MLAAFFVGIGNGFEFGFDFGLASGGRSSEAENRGWGLCGERCAECEEQRKNQRKVRKPGEAHDGILLRASAP